MSSKCIICDVNISQHDRTQVSKENAEVYGAVFQTFCKFFALTRVNEEDPLDFNEEIFPFCDKCKDDIGHLFILNSKLESIQTKISTVVSKISYAIIKNSTDEIITKTPTATTTTRRRKGGGKFVGPKRKNPNYRQGGSSSTLPLLEDDDVSSGSSRKVLRYRKTIIKQYNPTVVLRKADAKIQVKSKVVKPNNNSNKFPISHNFPTSISGEKARPSKNTVKSKTLNDFNDDYDCHDEVEDGYSGANFDDNFFDDDDGFDDDDDDDDDDDYQLPTRRKDSSKKPKRITQKKSKTTTDPHPAISYDLSIVKEEPIDDDDNDPISAILGPIEKLGNIPFPTKSATTINSDTVEDTDNQVLYFGTWPVIQKGSVHLCITCGVTPANKKGLYLHVKQQHGDPRKLTCSTCAKELVTEEEFAAHVTSVHPQLIEDAVDQIISCGEGRFLYKGRWFFEETAENEFQCAICGRVWPKRKDLLDHLMHHKDDAAVDGNEKFKCSQCELTFSTYMRRRYHIRSVHRQNQKICCRHCGEPVGTKLQLALHRTSGACKELTTPKVEAVENFICPVCSHKIINFPKFLVHLKTIHPGLVQDPHIIECGHGNLLCDTKWLLIQRKGWQCNFCQGYVQDREQIRSHIQTHPGAVCPVCGKTFRNNFSLGAHHRTAHRSIPEASNRERFYCRKLTGLFYELLPPKEEVETMDTTTTAEEGAEVKSEPEFKCSICDYLGSSHPQMIDHMEEHGDNPSGKKRKKVVVTTGKGQFLYCGKWPFTEEADGRFKCSTCQHTFRRRQDVVGHQRVTHANTVNIICDICGREFHWQQSFNLHMTTHSDVKKVKCDLCEYTCKTTSHLYAHKKAIHDPTDHQCDQCGKIFRTKQSLMKHCQSHSAGRKTRRPKKKNTFTGDDEVDLPHVCDYCPMRFKTLQGSSRHMNDHHRGERADEKRPGTAIPRPRGRPQKSSKQDMTSSESEEEEDEDLLFDDNEDADAAADDANEDGDKEEYQPNNVEVKYNDGNWTL